MKAHQDYSRVPRLLIFALAQVGLACIGYGDITISGDLGPPDESFWTGGGDAYTDAAIGIDSTGEVTVAGGSLLELNDVYFGTNQDVIGTMTVTGSGSQWRFDDLDLGDYGFGYLTVTDQGVVSGEYAYLGDEETGDGTATIQNSGQWILEDDFYVGNYGRGELSILTGGYVSSDYLYLGDRSTAYGSLTVDGSSSELSVASDIEVGYRGEATAVISNAATVTVGDDVFIGYRDSSLGNLTVTGVGSSLTTTYGDILVGHEGEGYLNVLAGATVGVGNSMTIASEVDSIGAVKVDGAGSQLDVTVDLQVGSSGFGSLNVLNGGVVSVSSSNVGYITGGEGTMKIDGVDSSLTAVNDVNIGHGGTGELYVSNGSELQAGQYFAVGVVDGGVGNAWIESGGNVTGGTVLIGAFEGSHGSITVSGAGSNLTSLGNFDVGREGTGSLLIENGGAVMATQEMYVGNGATGVGEVTVQGVGSALNTQQSLTIGNSGSVGKVSVSDGGRLSIGRDLNVNSGSKLNISVDGDAVITTGVAGEEGWGDFSNFGLINMMADSDLAAGDYSPVQIGPYGSYYNEGEVRAIGGSWDDATQVFSVSEITTDGTGDLSGKRVSYFDELVVSFADDVGEQSFEVEALDVESINGQEVLAAFAFDTTITEGTLLSYFVGEDLDDSTISIWHLADGETEWTLFTADYTEYIGDAFAFTVDSFSSYAVTQVPEPSLYAMLFGACVLMHVLRRRKR